MASRAKPLLVAILIVCSFSIISPKSFERKKFQPAGLLPAGTQRVAFSLLGKAVSYKLGGVALSTKTRFKPVQQRKQHRR